MKNHFIERVMKWIGQATLVLMLGLGIGAGIGLVQHNQSDGPVHVAHAQSADTSASTSAATTAGAPAAGDDFNFFSDKPVESKDIVVIPPEKSKWLTVGGPVALIVFMLFVLYLNWRLIPFEPHSVDINLRNFPPAAKRGMALAVVLFGIAFAGGASELWYQTQFFGSSADFVASFSLGKLIVMTHAHLFGFTTAFFIVGIPFSMQFNHIKFYQWIFPVGLAACLTDVISWWGIKYVAHSFEYVSMICAILFSFTYLFMLVGLLRTLAFPEVIWASDKDKKIRAEALKNKSTQ